MIQSEMPIFEIPGDEQEEPGIVGTGIRPADSTSERAARIRKIPMPRTFNDHFASRLIYFSLFGLALVWGLEFCFKENQFSSVLFEILKTIITTCLGYLFAAYKPKKNNE